MDQDSNYDIDSFIDLVRKSSNYDELRIQCDIQGVECIIARNEFDAMKSTFGDIRREIEDMSWMTM